MLFTPLSDGEGKAAKRRGGGAFNSPWLITPLSYGEG